VGTDGLDDRLGAGAGSLRVRGAVEAARREVLGAVELATFLRLAHDVGPAPGLEQDVESPQPQRQAERLARAIQVEEPFRAFRYPS